MAAVEGSRPAGHGPRLLGRLTADLISRSPQFMNPVREYELDLRGNKIGVIENLAVTQNQFDCIDLSDNAVVVLDGFPLLPRLSMLLVNNNRVARIAAANLERSLPGLETLILTNNRISRLEDLEGLSRLKHLKCLSLMDNPVTKIRGYRSFVINAVPTLRWLDFQRIRPSEREQARSAAPAKDAPGSFVPGEGVPDMETEAGEAGPGEGAAAQEERKRGPTAAELTAIKAAIANASTMQEVEALERALQTGEMPTHIKIGEENGGAEPMEQD